MKKIYLFEDLITNTVIPCFNIEELPDEIEAKDFNETLTGMISASGRK